jgi:protein MpaA
MPGLPLLVSAIALIALAAGGGNSDHSYAAKRMAVSAARQIERSLDGEGRRIERLTVGRSARGRPIEAITVEGTASGLKDERGIRVLVVGCIHGDECAGRRIVERLSRPGCPPPGDGLVLIPNLNPDGRAIGTRVNGRGVDLNRNFAAGWRLSGSPGDPEYSGPYPFSEPESQLARVLIDRLQPNVTIWFHQQAVSLVRAWGGSVTAARAYARLAGLPFQRAAWLPGTAPHWQNTRVAGTSSFVVELSSHGLSRARMSQYAWAAFMIGKEVR